MPNRDFRILAISGSIRTNSYNKGLIRTAQEVAPEGVTIETFDISQLPFFNQELEHHNPEVVHEFKDRIREADGLLIASPEYNYSISGVLKNALEWASRPITESTLRGKPIALMGAGGMSGTTRAQLHLRQILVGSQSLTLVGPEVLISNAYEKFDRDGNLTNEEGRERVEAMMQAFIAWIERLNYHGQREETPQPVASTNGHKAPTVTR